MELTQISKPCNECGGAGFLSSCCNAPIYERVNRCMYCGKFCSKNFCCEGYEIFKVGDDVHIFVCVYSPEYIKQYFHKPKKLGDCKSFTGKILKIIDDFNVLVKVKYSRKEPIKINVGEISEI
jgi:hypothetical protein